METQTTSGQRIFPWKIICADKSIIRKTHYDQEQSAHVFPECATQLSDLQRNVNQRGRGREARAPPPPPEACGSGDDHRVPQRTLRAVDPVEVPLGGPDQKPGPKSSRPPLGPQLRLPTKQWTLNAPSGPHRSVLQTRTCLSTVLVSVPPDGGGHQSLKSVMITCSEVLL